MKLSLSFLLLAIGVSASTVPLSSISRSTTSARYVPGEYIVEIKSLSGLAGKRTFSSPHEELYASMRKRDIPFDVKSEFNAPDLMVGATLKLSSTDDVAKVAQIAGVQAIRPVIRIPSPSRLNQYIPTSSTDPKLSSADTFSTHVMTGVDKVHAQGYHGEGIKIGIIDTGIDYTHPALGAGFGNGFKVIGGHDFVGDAYDGTNTPVEDNDPMDNCNGHGTHVAGIIGANPGNPFNINGVAYGSSISSYRVFGCTGSVSDDIIIAGLLRGASDGNDILTLSLGGVDGWTESSSSVVASRIAQKGTVVTIAAGNDGAYGSWYSSSPGNGLKVISVGSVDNVVTPVQNATVSGVTHDPIPYLQALPLKVTGPVPIYATSTDTSKTNDACDPLPSTTPDLSKYLVVIHRGTCAFTQKLGNAAAFGANKFLIYNSDTGSFSGIAVGNYTAALISADDGKFLVNQFAANASITLTFPQTGGQFSLPDPAGGLISSFSSYGPTFDMNFKPAVSAPGGNILSTLPLALGGYGVESGTSMATPFTAGSAALVLQVKGKGRDVKRGMRDLLQSTANAVPSEAGDVNGGVWQSLSVQGAGLIRVDLAIGVTTEVVPAQLLLNDTTHFKGFQTFTITNSAKTVQTYKLTHLPAGTALTVVNGTSAAVGPVALTSASAKVTFLSTSYTLQPGASTIVPVVFTPPSSDAQTYPVYSGFIQIASKTETVKVSYLGLAATLKEKSVVDHSDVYFGVKIPALLNANGDVQGNETSYTFKGGDAPSLLYRLNFGSPTVQLHLVSPNITLTPTLPLKRSFWSWWWGPSHSTSFSKVPTYGALAEFDYVPRNSIGADVKTNGYNAYTFDGSFANNTKIAKGSYKVLMRALRVSGNPGNEKDYESWLSPVFDVDV